MNEDGADDWKRDYVEIKSVVAWCGTTVRVGDSIMRLKRELTVEGQKHVEKRCLVKRILQHKINNASCYFVTDRFWVYITHAVVCPAFCIAEMKRWRELYQSWIAEYQSKLQRGKDCQWFPFADSIKVYEGKIKLIHKAIEDFDHE